MDLQEWNKLPNGLGNWFKACCKVAVNNQGVGAPKLFTITSALKPIVGHN